MIFFKEKVNPAYYMIDPDGKIMITLIGFEKVISIKQTFEEQFIKRMLDAYLTDDPKISIYDSISEAEFYRIYNSIQSMIETNYELFELHHFGYFNQ